MSNYCCSMHFKCVDCPIITSADCMAPGNLMPGQLYYNPCSCTFYFDAAGCDDSGDECCGYQALNHKAGAGILYSGDCELGSYISVKLDEDSALEFTEDGAITINCIKLVENCDLFSFSDEGACARLIDHCNLMAWDDPELCAKLSELCDFNPTITSCPGSINIEEGPDGEIELCIDTQTYYRNAGGSSGAGMCIGVQATSWEEGRAIFQSRTGTFIEGAGTVTSGAVPAGHFQETFTNPWLQPAVIDVTMVAQPNVIAADEDTRPLEPAHYLSGKHFTFIHSITEQLNVSPPAFGLNNSPVPENWCYTSLDTTNQFHRLAAVPTGSGDWSQARTTQGTNSARFVKILNPGETITLYYQWWGVIQQSQNSGVFEWILHGGMSTTSLLHKHAAPF